MEARQGPGEGSTKKPPLLSPPLGPGPPPHLCSHGGQPWLGTGAQAESLTPQGSEGMEPGRPSHLAPSTDWEAKAGEGTDGGGQRLESSPGTARFDSALTKPSRKGKEGEAGPWDGCGWARWGDGVGLWPGWAVGLRARPGLGGGSRARAGGLLIQPNNDETAPLSCGAKVAVTGGGVT